MGPSISSLARFFNFLPEIVIFPSSHQCSLLFPFTNIASTSSRSTLWLTIQLTDMSGWFVFVTNWTHFLCLGWTKTHRDEMNVNYLHFFCVKRTWTNGKQDKVQQCSTQVSANCNSQLAAIAMVIAIQSNLRLMLIPIVNCKLRYKPIVIASWL